MVIYQSQAGTKSKNGQHLKNAQKAVAYVAWQVGKHPSMKSSEAPPSSPISQAKKITQFSEDNQGPMYGSIA